MINLRFSATPGPVLARPDRCGECRYFWLDANQCGYFPATVVPIGNTTYATRPPAYKETKACALGERETTE